ncbi:unnamed protein product [Medioppia subpectinata]|uniref:glutamine synthetase n=1 Tax=Medioppia subpectinata TaxID=1979941 RepID=A0A7R9Q2H4_9ACAR|nr:unnamed protein product [Medioppia subpectinata]CAG2110369.1 unnamed protein product [Medioppia subpectinata]
MYTDFRQELLIRPVRIYRDPFRGGQNRLVLCDTLSSDDKTPMANNHRASCLDAMEKASDYETWFGVEQEYMLLDGVACKWHLGWPVNGYPEPVMSADALYHGAVGANNQYGRDVMEAHFRACMYAGVMISGENAEGQPSQWEYQVIMSRYILLRVAEDLHIGVTFDPKPVPGWLGCGAHMNFSTRRTRNSGGLAEIERACHKLAKTHAKHVRAYDPNGGADNQRRLTGLWWSSSSTEFTWGVADRSASVRVPKQVALTGRGYLDDRRPAANCDPYAVCEALYHKLHGLTTQKQGENGNYKDRRAELLSNHHDDQVASITSNVWIHRKHCKMKREGCVHTSDAFEACAELSCPDTCYYEQGEFKPSCDDERDSQVKEYHKMVDQRGLAEIDQDQGIVNMMIQDQVIMDKMDQDQVVMNQMDQDQVVMNQMN